MPLNPCCIHSSSGVWESFTIRGDEGPEVFELGDLGQRFSFEVFSLLDVQAHSGRSRIVDLSTLVLDLGGLGGHTIHLIYCLSVLKNIGGKDLKNELQIKLQSQYWFAIRLFSTIVQP